jgi:hypothetical protein
MTVMFNGQPHCHFTYELASGYRSYGWWPTPADALDAARVHDPDADAKLISEHVPGCACPDKEGTPE